MRRIVDRLGWVLLVVLVAVMIASAASSATLTVVNQTSSYVTVSVDGAYGCNTAPRTTCTIPVSTGQHRLRAVRSDNGVTINQDANITDRGFTWTLSEN